MTRIANNRRHASAAQRGRHLKVVVQPSLPEAAADRNWTNDVGVSHERIVTAPTT
jgi:hypothetical protein